MTDQNIEQDRPAKSKGSAAFPIGLVLTMGAAYTLSYLDRQVVNIVAEHIKHDLQLADWQLGAISGLAFALLYATLGIPVARIAERTNRSALISVALIVWSACTTVIGFAQNFWQLALARFGVGFGESGCTPPAMSLIADVTRPEQRSKALSIYNLGVPVGALLGMMLGGFLVDIVGWRAVFFIVGPPGILLAIVIFLFIKDPRSKKKTVNPLEDPAAALEPEDHVPKMSEVAKSLASKQAFIWMTLGTCLTVFVGYSMHAFLAPFFLRVHAEGLAELATSMGLPGPTSLVGLGLGIGLGLGGALGTLIGGHAGDFWKSKKVYAFTPGIGALLAAPTYALTFVIPSAGWAMLFLIIPSVLSSMWYGPVYASIQGLSHPRSRATAIAIFLFLLNAIGLGLGPLSVGLVSDTLAASLGAADGLRWAMIIVSGVSAISALCYWFAAKPLEKEMIE